MRITVMGAVVGGLSAPALARGGLGLVSRYVARYRFDPVAAFMSDLDWQRPWLNVARFLNVMAAHTVAAVALIALLGAGQYVLDRLAAVEETVWLQGTAHQFAAADLFHASDLAIVFLFIGFGIFPGIEELRK